MRPAHHHAPRRPLHALIGLLGCAVLCLGCGEKPAPAPASSDHATTFQYDADGRASRPAPEAKQTPNLIVIVIDTLRREAADRGDDPRAMESITTLAKEGVQARHAVSPASWTQPALASMLTGMRPSEHGVDDPVGHTRLPDHVTTFAEVLSATYGYETAAFVDGPFLGHANNLLQGFATGGTGFALQGTEAVVGRWARRRNKQKPFFLLLHTMEVHDPYGAENHTWPWRKPPLRSEAAARWGGLDKPWDIMRGYLQDGDVRQLLETPQHRPKLRALVRAMNHDVRAHPSADMADALDEVRDAYWRGVDWLDGVLTKSLASLEKEGLLENTLVVVTSDHGEAFGEHGIAGHGRRLDTELVSVPLVLQGPEPFVGGREMPGVVGTIDVLPTFFDWCGFVPPRANRGVSFLPQLRGSTAPRAPVASAVLAPPATLGDDRSLVVEAIVAEEWKFVITYDVHSGELHESIFNLQADPQERDNLVGEDGRIPSGLSFDDTFCEALEALREKMWATANAMAARNMTIYGGDVAALKSTRPPPCNEATRGG